MKYNNYNSNYNKLLKTITIFSTILATSLTITTPILATNPYSKDILSYKKSIL